MYRIYAMRGDPGISLKGIIRGVGKVAGAVVRSTPLGGIVSAGVGMLTSRSSTPSPPIASGFPGGLRLGPGTAVARPVAGRISPMGTVGVCGPGARLKKDGGCTTRKRPHMNAGNARAARRAITRISAARKLLRSIEVALPKSRLKVAPGKRCGCK